MNHILLANLLLLSTDLCTNIVITFYICCYFFIAENLSHAKEENIGMHQVLDQTLQELSSL